MDNELFRKKSLDRISSPEQMNDYIRVTNPGVWMVLGTIIALLAGVIIWAAAGRLETVVPVAVVAGDSGTFCYVPEAYAGSVAAGMPVRIGKEEYALGEPEPKPVAVDGSFDAYTLHIGGLTVGQWVYKTPVDADLADGAYEAGIVEDSVSPISFLLN